METKEFDYTMDKLREDLNDILPNRQFANEQTIMDMPQFLNPYLRAMKERALLLYPHREELIRNAYDHVIADLNDSYLISLMK